MVEFELCKQTIIIKLKYAYFKTKYNPIQLKSIKTS